MISDPALDDVAGLLRDIAAMRAGMTTEWRVVHPRRPPQCFDTRRDALECYLMHLELARDQDQETQRAILAELRVESRRVSEWERVHG